MPARGRRICYAPHLGRLVVRADRTSIQWRVHLDLITGVLPVCLAARGRRARRFAPSPDHRPRFRGRLTAARTRRHIEPTRTTMKHVPNPSKACDFAGVAKPCAVQSPTDSSPSDALPPTAKAVGFHAVPR